MHVRTEGEERNRALGAFGAVSGSSGAIGVLLGGMLTQYLNWQWVLFVNVPIGLLVLALTPRLLAETRNTTSGGFEILGAVTVTAGMTALVDGFISAAQPGWGAPIVTGSFIAAAVLLGGFVAIEAHSSNPLLPLSMFRRRNLTGGSLVTLALQGALFGTFYFLSLYLQQTRGYSALQAGLAYLPISVAIILISGVASRLATRLAPRPIIVTGLA
jgi:predicted MFS family arabinose efflux permease